MYSCSPHPVIVPCGLSLFPMGCWDSPCTKWHETSIIGKREIRSTILCNPNLNWINFGMCILKMVHFTWRLEWLHLLRALVCLSSSWTMILADKPLLWTQHPKAIVWGFVMTLNIPHPFLQLVWSLYTQCSPRPQHSNYLAKSWTTWSHILIIPSLSFIYPSLRIFPSYV